MAEIPSSIQISDTLVDSEACSCRGDPAQLLLLEYQQHCWRVDLPFSPGCCGPSLLDDTTGRGSLLLLLLLMLKEDIVLSEDYLHSCLNNYNMKHEMKKLDGILFLLFSYGFCV
jgi:hypothetical protein